MFFIANTVCTFIYMYIYCKHIYIFYYFLKIKVLNINTISKNRLSGKCYEYRVEFGCSDIECHNIME